MQGRQNMIQAIKDNVRNVGPKARLKTLIM